MVQSSNNFASSVFPKCHSLLNGFDRLAGFDVMPPPVIEPSHMPTVFEIAVEQEYFPQKTARLPKIIFFCTSPSFKFHGLFLLYT
jgi:hypothetical protein